MRTHSLRCLLSAVLAAHAMPAGGAAEPATAATNTEASLESLLPRLKPTSPGDSLKTFRIEPGFKIELAAAEPNVSDPSAMEWDENGRLFVCELWNYPGVPKEGERLGRIRMLEDLDGDGVYEKATVFADNLRWPGGVACWDGGLFVISSPDVWYLKDTDGDGKADLRVKVLTGFNGETYEIANTLRWGLDNRFYGSASYAGGNIRWLANSNAPAIALRRRDWSFDPRSGALAAVSGSGEFGNSFDDWGNRFTCNANTMFIHGVLPAEYLARNPFFPSPDPSESAFRGFPDVFAISAPEPWRTVRQKFWQRWVNTSQNMNAGRFPENELAGRGHLTSGSGLTVYRGSAFPEAYRGNAFLGEPANNLVIRLALEPDGVGIKPIRAGAEGKREFLASTDAWFRPVNFANGPDGCLYIATMYREVIEDETAIPDDILKYLDLHSGRDRGRIYRIAPEGFQRPAQPRLGRASTEELVATLAHPNGWQRDTAQRLLCERQDKTAVNPLRRLARSSTLPQARLHALHALEGLGSLDAATLLQALQDGDARVREHAARLAEPHLASSSEIRAKLCALADDPQVRVRFQAACTLGALSDAEAVAALARIMQRDAADKWVRTAVLTAVPTTAGELFSSLLGVPTFLDADQGVLSQLALIVGARNDLAEVARVLNSLASPALRQRPELQRAVLRQLGDGLGRSGSSLADLMTPSNPVNAGLHSLFIGAQQSAVDESKPLSERAGAVQLLAYGPPDLGRDTLVRLLGPAQAPPIQMAAVRAFSAQKDSDVAGILLSHWRGFSPSVRSETLDALLRRPERTIQLLAALESRAMNPAELDLARRNALLKHKDPALRDRATKLFGASQNRDRQRVIDRYRTGIAGLTGDAARGAEIFDKNCATCHRHTPRENVGPRIGGLTDRSPDNLLTSILDPNRAVKPAFISYSVTTKDGNELSGVIVNESATSVTIRRAGGEEDNVFRRNIESITSSSLSLMPEGLEAAINEQQMADLIRFLQTYQD